MKDEEEDKGEDEDKDKREDEDGRRRLKKSIKKQSECILYKYKY